jgi:hypothetical protein
MHTRARLGRYMYIYKYIHMYGRTYTFLCRKDRTVREPEPQSVEAQLYTSPIMVLPHLPTLWALHFGHARGRFATANVISCANGVAV